MKRILKFAVISMMSILFYFPVHAVVTDDNSAHPLIDTVLHTDVLFTPQQILALTPKNYRYLTGHKMSFGQRISLKLVQYKIKKQLNRNEAVNLQKANKDIDATDFSFAGFLLGFLLSIFGVLIAYLIGDRRKIKWSWYGFGFGALIIVLILIFK